MCAHAPMGNSSRHLKSLSFHPLSLLRPLTPLSLSNLLERSSSKKSQSLVMLYVTFFFQSPMCFLIPFCFSFTSSLFPVSDKSCSLAPTFIKGRNISTFLLQVNYSKSLSKHSEKQRSLQLHFVKHDFHPDPKPQKPSLGTQVSLQVHPWPDRCSTPVFSLSVVSQHMFLSNQAQLAN